MTQLLTMATKTLLRTVLNGPSRSSAVWANCPRCFTSNPTVRPVERYSRRCITSASFASGATGTERVAPLTKCRRAPPSFPPSKKLSSDSKTEHGKEKLLSSEDIEKARHFGESDDVDEDKRELSASPNGTSEMDLPDRDSSDSENGLYAQIMDNFKEVKDETSGSLVIRNESDNELDFIDDQDNLDILAPSAVLEDFIQPFLPTASLTLAAYVDHSPSLQRLVELGVDLSRVERKARIGNALIRMDFERHMKDKIVLLHSAGVTPENGLGRFLTINPFFLTEELENLETRLRYLRSKKFSANAITQVLNRAPYFLSFSVERVDSKLGFYQKELSLTGNELRTIITKTPKLVTFKIQRVKENIFVCRQQLGFTTFELKNLILKEPRLLLRGKEKLIGMFDYLHNHMGIPHKQIVKNPQVFNGRVFKMQERHQFLKMLRRAQYDPTQPGFVAIERLAKLPDEVFCRDIGMSSLEEYDDFLKTL